MAVFFPWISSFETGIPVIDAQHRVLVDLLNKLFDAMNNGQGNETVGEILDELIQYTMTHFDMEELLLQNSGVANWEAHKKEHDYFRKQIRQFQADLHARKIHLSVDVATFLKDWLKNHILHNDKKMLGQLNAGKANETCLTPGQ